MRVVKPTRVGNGSTLPALTDVVPTREQHSTGELGALDAVSAPVSREVSAERELLTRSLEALSPAAGTIRFRGPTQVEAEVRRLEALGVRVEEIGRSQEGRPMFALTVGEGPVRIAALSGAHPDEPVGAATCFLLAEKIHTDPRLAELKQKITLHLVPMANPDGSARNEPWFQSWMEKPDIASYLRKVQRDLPAADVEFGFPDRPDAAVRPENAALARWLEGLGELDHYVSLHSMFLGGGALFLALAEDLAAAAPRIHFALERVQALGMGLHDVDRAGQKGFHRLGPGLQTAPTAEAMREFFAQGGQKSVADNFKLASFQYAQRKNGCPLGMVTEIPLCYDPRLSSRKATSMPRAKAEKKLAGDLRAVYAEARTWAEQLNPLGQQPASARKLESFRSRIANGEATLASLEADLSRYGDALATEGDLCGHRLNVLRRKAALLSDAIEVAQLGTGSEALEIGRNFNDLRDATLTQLGNEFDLRHPTLEGQVQAQMAATLSGVLPISPKSPGDPHVEKVEAHSR